MASTDNQSSIFVKTLISILLIVVAIGIAISFGARLQLENSLKESGINQEISNEILSDFIIFTCSLTLAIMILAIFFAYVFSRQISKPLDKLIGATKKIGAGDYNFLDFSQDSNDEVAELSHSIASMTENLRQSQAALESYNKGMAEKVKDKTIELEQALEKLNSDKEELENQRLATLNILEDIYESKDELESLNEALTNKSFELEALKSFSDELTGVFKLDEVFGIVNKYLSKVLEYNIVTYLVFSGNNENNIFYRSYLNGDVSDNFVASVNAEIIKFINYQKDKGYDIPNSLKKKPQIVGGSVKLDEPIRPAATFMLPLIVGGKMLGVFHLASFNIDYYNKKESKGFFNAMAATLSVAIARLEAINKFQTSRTETLVKSLEDGVVMFNNEGKILLINPSAQKICGFNIGGSIGDMLEKISKNDYVKVVNEVLLKEKIKHFPEVEMNNNIFEFFITPVKDHEGKIVSGAMIIHDITHIKEVDKMKTEFVSVASHQLRTPLTAIKLFTEMMLNGQAGNLNKQQKDYLENIFQSTERMVRLVNDLLNLSRLESGRLKIEPINTDLVKFVEDIVNEIVPVAEARKISINIKTDIIGKMVPIDPNLMRQVVHNLVANAVRYSPEKTGKVLINIQKKKDNYQVSVKDNGIGIPKDKQNRIFEKFFRADNAVKTETEGTGLGLYVSKMIAEISGGKLWFDSVENKGTSFYLSIPAEGMKAKAGEKSVSNT